MRRRARRDERGNEGISMMLALPLLLLLFLGSIEVGWNFYIRNRVFGVVRDITRGAAADGGNFNPRTNKIGQQWAQEGFTTLTVEYRCQCTAPPVVSCTPHPVAATAGDEVACTVTYNYRPLTGFFRGSLANAIGLDGLFGPFTIRQTARAETGATT